MKTVKVFTLLVLGLLISTAGYSQNQATVRKKMNNELIKKERPMKTYLIERKIPDAGKLTKEQLKGISQNSNAVVAEIGPGIEWIHSYVTDDKVYCVYKAQNEDLIIKHAEEGSFPVNNISELATTISPNTAKD